MPIPKFKGNKVDPPQIVVPAPNVTVEAAAAPNVNVQVQPARIPPPPNVTVQAASPTVVPAPEVTVTPNITVEPSDVTTGDINISDPAWLLPENVAVIVDATEGAQASGQYELINNKHVVPFPEWQEPLEDNKNAIQYMRNHYYYGIAKVISNRDDSIGTWNASGQRIEINNVAYSDFQTRLITTQILNQEAIIRGKRRVDGRTIDGNALYHIILAYRDTGRYNENSRYAYHIQHRDHFHNNVYFVLPFKADGTRLPGYLMQYWYDSDSVSILNLPIEFSHNENLVRGTPTITLSNFKWLTDARLISWGALLERIETPAYHKRSVT